MGADSIRCPVFLSGNGRRLNRKVSPFAGALLSFASPKESKQRKGAPGLAPGYAGCPALLASGGGTPGVLLRDAWHRSGRCGTRPCGAQTVLALFPPAPALLGAQQGKGKTDRSLNRIDSPSPASGRPHRQRSAGEGKSTCDALSNAVWRGVVGEDCLRPEAEFRSPRAGRVAQGNRRSRARSLGRLLFAYFFLAKQEKVRRPRRAKPCTSVLNRA